MKNVVKVRKQSNGLDVTVSIPSHMRDDFCDAGFAVVEKIGDAVVYRPVKMTMTPVTPTRQDQQVTGAGTQPGGYGNE